MDWEKWAQRKMSQPRVAASGPGQAASLPRPSQVGSSAPPGSPPPGYAWCAHPSAGWVLMALVPQSTTFIPAPVRQPDGVGPFCPVPIGYPQLRPGQIAPQERTCVLVKPGDRDLYAELLARVPSLVPVSQYDAMSGRPDPQVQAELGNLPEFHDLGPVAQEAPTQAYPTSGKGAPLAKAQGLSPAALPPVPIGLEEGKTN